MSRLYNELRAIPGATYDRFLRTALDMTDTNAGKPDNTYGSAFAADSSAILNDSFPSLAKGIQSIQGDFTDGWEEFQINKDKFILGAAVLGVTLSLSASRRPELAKHLKILPDDLLLLDFESTVRNNVLVRELPRNKISGLSELESKAFRLKNKVLSLYPRFTSGASKQPRYAKELRSSESYSIGHTAAAITLGLISRGM